MRLQHLRTLLTLAALVPLCHAPQATAGGLPPFPPPSSGAVGVAAGDQITCVVTAAGGAQCWGSNWGGRLGDGTDVNRSSPADVSGLASGVAAVAAGSSSLHTCALTSGGGVMCWGWNGNGNLGDGTTTARATPVAVVGLGSGVTSVSVGNTHSCAVLTGGAVKCWGGNTYGQLGDGTTVDRLTPVGVIDLPGPVTSVAAGVNHSCAVTASGSAACWGDNSGGQLGDGTAVSRLTPAAVSGLASGVATVAAGYRYTCALLTSGGVKCWGLNTSGQLGDGTTTTSVTAVNVAGLASGVAAIAAGDDYACAVMVGGGVKCWGANDAGQIGDGTVTPRLTATNVLNLAQTVSAVSAGRDHTCALATDGGVQCWGSDAYGTLGLGSDIRRLTPADVIGLGSGVSGLSAGSSHACARMSGGSARCWGENWYGQLGDGTTISRATPALVSGLSGSVWASAAGTGHTCAVTDGGGVKCWGGNGNGQLGDGTTSPSTTAADVSGLASGVLAVGAGWNHSCAVTSAGGLKCWGSNSSGQLGDGSTTQRTTPVDVAGLSAGVVRVAGGPGHTCALTATGGVKCWGFNGNGELGDGTTTTRSTPVDVAGLTSGVLAIATGGVHSCALLSSGGIKCWGYNGWGQLGDGTVNRRLTPVDVVGMTGATVLATGYWHTCAVAGSGATKCWGQNSNGQVGDGTMTDRWTPTDVAGLGGVNALRAGMYFSCALTSGGGVKCWGDDTAGQLGDGRALTRLWPANAVGFGATITLANLTQVYDGNPKPVSVGTTPPGLDVTVTYTGIGATTYGPSQSAPSGVGTYTAFAEVTDTGFIGSGSATAVLTIVNPTLAVSAVIPSLGTASGGTTITISGTGFGAGATVLIGGVEATGVVVVNADTITAVTPAHSAGAADVVVTNGGQSGTLSGGFTFIAVDTSRVQRVAGGYLHTCAVTSSGGVVCWGDNSSGQLGDGTYIERTTATGVAGLASGVSAVAAGHYHSCALTSTGGMKCWGANQFGQLGDGTTTQRLSPTNVAGLSAGVAAISVGPYHTCALTTAGGVKCWGYNSYGRLGDGTTTQRLTPTNVVGLTTGMVAVAAGWYHTCAAASGGGVKCWGNNGDGQLGDGTRTDRTTPVGVIGLTAGISAVASGMGHTCALTTAGGLKCWGSGGYGQLGDGSWTGRTTPTDVAGLTSGVVAVATGEAHSCAVTQIGGATCWGDNSVGQLGDGTVTRRATPTAVMGLTSGVADIAAGSSHTCAVTTAGGVRCFGSNSNGQMGDGSSTQKTTPMAVAGMTTAVAAVAAGGSQTCAVTTGGGLKCWGDNISGQVGDGTTTRRTAPTDVVGLTSGVKAVAVGWTHTCALTTGGGVKCWGNNRSGELGDGTGANRLIPTDVVGLTSGVAAIAAGYAHTCALTTGGAVLCWGLNVSGQLGNGTTTDRWTPTAVVGLGSGVLALEAGWGHTCAVTTSGGLKCWGLGSSGQLGDGAGTQWNTPTDVVGLTSGTAAVDGGWEHTCAVTASGAAKCFGSNLFGQVGDGATTNSWTPTAVVGLASGVGKVAAGSLHTCVVMTGGGVRCWGQGRYGQLGNGTKPEKQGTPTDVMGLAGGVTAVAAGDYHTCALTTNGALQCWGDNDHGQLGDPTSGPRLAPAAVIGLEGGAVAPGVTAVSPPSGPPEGGTAVTITGTGFRAGAAVTFGGTPAAAVVVASATTITAVTPAHAAGAVDVVVTNDDSQSGTLPGAFTYAAPAPRASIAAGWEHTCALTAGGGVACWGANFVGQLGDGTTADTSTPTAVSGLGSGVAAVTAGSDHTCALTTGGGVFCWGSNIYGQLGDGTTIDRLTPTAVAGLSNGVVALAAGLYNTCALLANGGVVCWGENYSGQIGDGTTTNRSTPTAVSGLNSGVTAIAAGDFYACALRTSGGMVCWGDNGSGRLGDGTSTSRSTPTAVSGLASGVQSIAAGGGHTCALTTGGGVLCWGSNSDGQVGDGTTTDRLTPTAVSGLASGIAAIEAGEQYTCAVASGGNALCWGYNGHGQLGDGTTANRLTPTAASGFTGGVAELAAGNVHTCARLADSTLACWGDSESGRLGEGTAVVRQRTTPTAIVGLPVGAAALTAGAFHTCALTGAGGVLCWGRNELGQLGDGTQTGRSMPTPVMGLTSGIADVTPGDGHTCALTAGGGVLCWGFNGTGQIGDGTTTDRLVPTTVWGLASGTAQVSAGGSHTCALTTGGGVVCWGWNYSGQIGDGTDSTRMTPTAVSGLANGVAVVAAGGSHTCALTTGGGVMCWGANANGQLGDGTTTSRRLTPTAVSGLTSGITAIAAGSAHTCALAADGSVLCWGSNLLGQLGDGTTTDRTTPTPVSGLASGVVSIAVRGPHTCALTAEGSVLCWGFNAEGQLGDGTSTDRLVPTVVLGLVSGTTAVTVGNRHTCALNAAGRVVCWGDDEEGQLGLGTRILATAPIGVYGFGGAIAAGTIDPTHGPSTGGTVVTITGAFFLQGASVTIGGVPATSVTVINTETIMAITGAHGVGTADVAVLNPDGTAATLTGAFAYGADGGHARGDFTGDGKSDVLWRHASGGDLWLWPMDGPARTAESYVRTVSDTNWEIRAIADFDGDGKADLFWRNKVNGQLYFWPMNGASPQGETYVGTVSPAYDIVGSGDFNGDGQADLLWRHTALGDAWVWLMDGATPLSQVFIDRVDPGYLVKGIGDLNANGKADIVWHGAAGDVWVWPMNGTTRLDQVWVGTVPDTGYQIEGVADVTGDGKADLMWWHATRGEVWLWTMNGTTREAETWVATVPDTNYRIAATGDYNGDTKTDLLWRNVLNGEVWVWLMNGPVRVSETWVATVPDTGYRVVTPR